MAAHRQSIRHAPTAISHPSFLITNSAEDGTRAQIATDSLLQSLNSCLRCAELTLAAIFLLRDQTHTLFSSFVLEIYFFALSVREKEEIRLLGCFLAWDLLYFI